MFPLNRCEHDCRRIVLGVALFANPPTTVYLFQIAQNELQRTLLPFVLARVLVQRVAQRVDQNVREWVLPVAGFEVCVKPDELIDHDASSEGGVA